MNMDNKVLVEIFHSGNNYSAHAPILTGCVATGDTPQAIMKNIKEAIAFHVESSLADNDPIPDVFKHAYELVYKFDTQSLLNYYKGVFTISAFERLTGINRKQVQHYSSGLKRPRMAQRKKIQTALNKLGEELMAVEL
jgi:predicted RNase H-like HicB family nuclease